MRRASKNRSGVFTAATVTHCVNRVAQALRMATQTLYRSHSALGEFFRRKRARVGTPQAITDTAYKTARLIYHLVTRHELYDDRILFDQQHQARALGFQLVIEAA